MEKIELKLSFDKEIIDILDKFAKILNKSREDTLEFCLIVQYVLHDENQKYLKKKEDHGPYYW